LDLSQMDLHKFPSTTALDKQFERGMTMVQKFWLSRLDEGSLIKGESGWRTELLSMEFSPSVTLHAFHQEYVEYANRLGERHMETELIFIRSLTSICPKLTRKRRKTAKHGERVVCTFPPLEECRKAFEKAMGRKVRWPETDKK
jgi:hypothetical protein